jgi:colanic acid biosynthesis protein WcaH
MDNKPQGRLDATTFAAVVHSAPLISIDLLVQNEQGEYLLGLRTNRPAQGCWFVPGGRIQKKETLDAAFLRLTTEELGITLERSQAVFKGVYEHFYQDSVFGEQPSTHYIVLAHQLVLPTEKVQLSVQQHDNAQWLKAEDILADPNVHRYTKLYFNGL